MVAYTDENAVYTFTEITTIRVIVAPSLEGLVNGAISSNNASEILADLVADASAFSEYQRVDADVDGDGKLTAHDAAFIFQKSASVIDGAFPGIGAEWIFKGVNVVNLDTDKFDMDFTAILLRDVTGDWTATSEKMD